MNAQPRARLLIVDDEAAQMKALCDTLTMEGYVTSGFTSARKALEHLKQHEFDLVLTDLMMPEMDGIALLSAAKQIDSNLVGILMTGHGTIDTAVRAMQAGALDYILKPFRLNVVLPVLSRALALQKLQAENMQLRESVAIYELSTAIRRGLDFDTVLGSATRALFENLGATSACVLLPTGEAGTFRVATAEGEAAASLADLRLTGDPHRDEWLAASRRALESPAASDESIFAEHPFRERIGGLAVPIVAHDDLIGVLCFRVPRRLRTGQLKGLNILCSAVASALAAARLIEELRTVNVQLEQRVRERTRELEAANRDLESFSYSVSHDLRAPLRAIKGFCDIYMTDYAQTIPEDGRPILQHVQAGAERMGQLIEDLLAFSRFSREPMLKRTVPLRAIVERILGDLRMKEPERHIDVRVGELPDCHGDPSLLEQVLVNLLANAFKFTRGRDPAVIEVGCETSGPEQVYFVRDNGAGFDMKYADKLFGVFQRLHSASQFEGTGVGLSICHRIIQRHGGRIWAESKPDEGATFRFSLPHE